MSTQTTEVLLGHGGNLHLLVMAFSALLSGFTVILAQVGFGLLGTGMVRGKNAGSTMATSLMLFLAAVLGYWTLGFAFQNGGTGGFAGMSGFLFSAPGAEGTGALFLCCVGAATVSATVPMGATAERTRLGAMAVFAFVASAFIYPIYAHWVWGGGWLSSLGRSSHLGHGVVDCSGSGVVHLTGGLLALAAAKAIGPRLGKYGLRGDVRPIPAHNMPLVVLGTSLLAAAWFSLTTSTSLLSGENASAMAVNVLLAAAAGGLAAFVHTRLRFGKPDLTMMCNGFLAGIVSISASGIYVGGRSSFVIGIIASVIALEGTLLLERKLRVDDPIGAFAVHGLGGAWGLLAVGLFADGRAGDGLNGVSGPVKGVIAGSTGQLVASLIGIVANVLWVAPLAMGVLWTIGRLIGCRVSADDEIAGLDVPELGMTGYMIESAHVSAARGSDLGAAGKSAKRT